MSVLLSMGACTMAVSVGGARRDDDSRSSCGVLGLMMEHVDCATARLGGGGGTPMRMATTNLAAAQWNPLFEPMAPSRLIDDNNNRVGEFISNSVIIT
jgi:hypothetical protein